MIDSDNDQSSRNFQFKDGDGSSLMFIGDDGNVGIGTTSPNPFSWGTRHLTVQSAGTNTYAAIDIIGSGSGAGALLFGGGSGSGTATNIGRAQISALDGSHLAFYTNGSNSGASFNERMRITSGGNVGIGTPSPNSKLQVDGHVRAENSAFLAGREDAAAPAHSFHDDADTGMFNINPNILGFSTAGTERMRIDAVGDISMTGGLAVQKQFTTGTNQSSGQTYITIRNYDAALTDAGDIQSVLRMTGR